MGCQCVYTSADYRLGLLQKATWLTTKRLSSAAHTEPANHGRCQPQPLPLPHRAQTRDPGQERLGLLGAQEALRCPRISFVASLALETKTLRTPAEPACPSLVQLEEALQANSATGSPRVRRGPATTFPIASVGSCCLTNKAACRRFGPSAPGWSKFCASSDSVFSPAIGPQRCLDGFAWGLRAM